MKIKIVIVLNTAGPLALARSLWPVSVNRVNATPRKASIKAVDKAQTKLEMPNET